jgi:hypothetical protein
LGEYGWGDNVRDSVSGPAESTAGIVGEVNAESCSSVGVWLMANVVSSYEFDVHPNVVATVELRESPVGDDVLICWSGHDLPVLNAWRDQWGVWYSVNGVTIAQEDCTRSFIDAMIQCLTELRQRSECGTLPAIKKPPA